MGAVKSYDTLAQMNADLVPADGDVAIVVDDPTVANNAVYRKQGASGAGSWVKKQLHEPRAATTFISLLGDGVTTSFYPLKLGALDSNLIRVGWQGKQTLSKITRRIKNYRSQPTSLSHCPWRSGGVTIGNLTDHGLAGGVVFPAAQQTDYAQVTVDSLAVGVLYACSFFVKMNDLSKPVVGAHTDPTADFSVKVSGEIFYAGAIYTDLGGGLWRVDIPVTLSNVGAIIGYGLHRYPVHTGEGFIVTGFMLIESATFYPYINNPNSAPLDVSDYSEAPDGKITLSAAPEAGAYVYFEPTTVAPSAGIPQAAVTGLVGEVARITALEGATADLPAALEAFDTVYSKNLFVVAAAANGYYVNASGDQAPYADSIAFGKQPVEEGKTYTFSMAPEEIGYQQMVYCYNAAGAYLGLHPIAPTPLTGVSWKDAYRTITFTNPVGSGIAYVQLRSNYFAHTVGDYNRIIGGVQLEEGPVKTAFESPTLPPKKVVKTAHVSAEIARAADTPYRMPGLSAEKGGILVQKVGGYLYVRTAWSAAFDLVQKIEYTAGLAFENDVITPKSAALIPADTVHELTFVAFISGEVMVMQGDDAAPAYYNGTYIGGRHGPSFLHEVTAAGHGKTVEDVGSTWTGAGHTWTIMRIVDANKLWLLSEDTGAAGIWNFSLATLANTFLNHLSGATHTDPIPVTADTTGQQLRPIIQRQIKAIRLDGRAEITEDGIYYCETLSLSDAYDIANPVGVLNYVRSQVGSASQPSFNAPSIESDFRLTTTWTYAANGSCTVYARARARNDVQLRYFGLTQAGGLSFAGKDIIQYIPKVKPWQGALKLWNWAAGEDTTAQVETYYCTDDQWLSTNDPPERLAQIVKNGGVAEYGHVVGYGQLRGVGIPLLRKALVDEALWVKDTRKMYPEAVTGSAYPDGVMPAGTQVEGICYRALFNPAVLPEATVFAWYFDGADVVVVLDFHQTVDRLNVPLPAWMIGKMASVIDSKSFTLHTRAVDEDGLTVSIDGNYGYATIRLAGTKGGGGVGVR
jgi:hypothetical protein